MSHNGYNELLQLEKGKTVGKLMGELIVSVGAEESQVREISGAVVGAEGAHPSSLFCHGKHRTEGFKGQTCLGKEEPHFHQNTV